MPGWRCRDVSTQLRPGGCRPLIGIWERGVEWPVRVGSSRGALWPGWGLIGVRPAVRPAVRGEVLLARTRSLGVCAGQPSCESWKGKRLRCACVGSLCELPSWTSSGLCVLGECAKVASSTPPHPQPSLWRFRLWPEAA